MPEQPSPAGDTRPPYLHIADVLRGEILDGLFHVGQRIPSQDELADRFNVSRPTVQRALTELRKGGYIDNQRGRPAEVLPRGEWDGAGALIASAAEESEPEPAYEALATYMGEAFEQRHVTIDAYSLTTETLNTQLALQFQRIRRGEIHPASIRVRLLLPSQDASLALPRMVADPSDDRPLRRLRQLVRGHVIALRSSFTSVSDFQPDIEQAVEFRTVPITPLEKLYLINGELALSGYYRVVERSVMFADEQWEDIYDVLGIDATLFPHRRDPARPDSYASRFVAESQTWFDSLWSTIAKPLSLFE